MNIIVQVVVGILLISIATDLEEIKDLLKNN